MENQNPDNLDQKEAFQGGVIDRMHVFVGRKSVRVISALALSATLAGSTAPQMFEHEKPPTVAETFLPHDSNGQAVQFTPETTINLASTAKTDPETYQPPLMPEQITTRVADYYCKTPNVSQPNYLNYESITKGGHTNFALSNEEMKGVSTGLDSLTSIAAIQSSMKKVFNNLGVTASYDKPVYANSGTPKSQKSEEAPDQINSYKFQMKEVLAGLAILPREMLSRVKTIDFVSARVLLPDQNPASAAGGLFYDDSGTVEIAAYDEEIKRVLVHELAHSMHADACHTYGAFDDKEFEAAYDQALSLLQPGPVRQTYVENLQFGTDYERKMQDENNNTFGFPSEYSKKDYIELFAELTTSLIVDGSFIDATHGFAENENARKLQALVIERLQKEMPDTDVAGYVQFMDYYHLQAQDVVLPLPFSEFVDKRISPMDHTYSDYSFQPDIGVTLSPAIAVKGNPGEPVQYIYAAYSTTSKMPYAEINLYTPDESVRLLAKKAATRYMKELKEKHPEFGDSNISYNEFSGQLDITLQPPVPANVKGGGYGK